MKVFINTKEIRIFQGARIRDAVLACSPRLLHMVLAGKLTVHDRFGNLTELDGPLTEGQRLTLRRVQSP
jgi:hypothetical protein